MWSKTEELVGLCNRYSLVLGLRWLEPKNKYLSRTLSSFFYISIVYPADIWYWRWCFENEERLSHPILGSIMNLVVGRIIGGGGLEVCVPPFLISMFDFERWHISRRNRTCRHVCCGEQFVLQVLVSHNRNPLAFPQKSSNGAFCDVTVILNHNQMNEMIC